MSQNDNSNQTQEKDSPEVVQELSQVATNPKQNILILAVILSVFAYLFFNLFIGNDDADQKVEVAPIPSNVIKPIEDDSIDDTPSIPTLPTPPKLEDPVPPAAPEAEPLPSTPTLLPELPSTPVVVTPPETIGLPAQPALFNNNQNDTTNKRLETKRKSSMILVSGTQNVKTAEQVQQEADFKYRGDMNLVLGRGKMLDAVIETSINTDIGGEIRGIISRDIYSEWGKNILLPKGSRVFGSYSTGIDGAYGRISIEWTRVDLANGYTLNLSGTGTDQLGRKGNQGRVDNKFKERFSNAILRSAFNVTLASGLDSLVKPATSTAAAASLNQTASNVKTIATGILIGTTETTPATKSLAICTQTQAAITDQTLALYTTIKTACDATYSGDTDGSAKLTAVMTAVNSGSDTLVQGTAASVTETQAQTASKQAFTDVSDVVKTLVEEQTFAPTITIDQGTRIKIYVNKDYLFPKAALTKSRSMR